MDFVKHNLIFVVLLAVCVIALGAMTFLCTRANTSLQAEMEQTVKVQRYLKGVASKRIALTQENIDKAEAEAKGTAAIRDAFVDALRKRFQLPYETPDIPLVALRQLKEQVGTLREHLLDSDIELSSKCENFTFDEFMKATQAPKKEDLPKIFRKFELIRRLMGILVETRKKDAKVSDIPFGIESIIFIKNMDVVEEQNYTVTPMELTFHASNAEGQAVVNALSHSKDMLFFVRNVTLESKAAVTQAASQAGLSGKTETANTAAPDEMGGGRPASRRQRGENVETKQEESAGNQLIELPKFRQEYVAFEPSTVRWKIRLDYLEYPPVKKPEGDGSDNNKQEAPEAAE